MEGLSSIESLQALSALLSTPNEDEEDDDFKTVGPVSKMGPGHIGATSGKDGSERREVSATYVKKNTKAIWDDDEVMEGAQFDDLIDPRPQPKYEIILKQSIGTEDLFLGLSGKDPSSMCCDSMLVRVKLPETKASDLMLDVREKFLDLRTPKFKLGLHLPHPVHSEEGRARFITEREELEITLPMNRPLDFINLH
ncbi:dynein axonemal assembly factor 6 [Chanos chanos]|uniref:Dynein axonemal assembly factor 6 n=1 Tax=Chanos chanos TaxID=29144 RepID=A0A6J2VBV7_CHACN|nr:protein PIH1D3 [Chanos chanos]